MIEQVIQNAMASEKVTAISCTRREDGTLRWEATFATETDARAFKTSGHGGWVLGRHWYDCSWTQSQVMQACPASGQLY